MLPGMNVEHEVNQRSLKLCTQAPVNGEPRSRYLAGSIEIQDTELRSQFPVGPRFYIEFRLFADEANFRVGGSIRTYRDCRVRKVGNGQLDRSEFLRRVP